MEDRYGRPLRDFRISVLDACNMECFYCHREGHYLSMGRMTPQEIEAIVNVAVDLGVRTVKITGGEPLLREDLEDITRRLRVLEGLTEISMVSNARLLDHERASRLKKEGLDRVNINLPSTNPQRYKYITGGSLEDAVEGLRAAVRVGLTPVKLNMVLMKGLNDDGVEEAMTFARCENVVLQLIELEPLGISGADYEKYHCPLDLLQEKLEKSALSVEVRRHMQARRVYRLSGLDVELVRPIENTEFCGHCTRIRLTSDGRLKPCLMRDDNLVDVLTPLRKGGSEEELKKIFKQAVSLREPYWRPK